MAFVPEFACGFEMGVLPLQAGKFSRGTAVGTAGVTSNYRHTGAYCLNLNNQWWAVVRETPGNAVDLSVWWQPRTAANATGRIEFLAGGSVKLDVRWVSGGFWAAYLNGTTLLATGTVATAVNTHQHIQVRATIAAAGTVQTTIDGIPDIDYSGVLGAGDIDTVRVRSSGAGLHYIDDLVFGTGGWPGDLRIDPLYASADTVTAEWLPVTPGDHYAMVEDAPPSADYVYTDADGRELYELTDWDDTDGAGTVVKDPLAVTLWAQVRKEDASLDDQFRLLQSDGANEVDSGYTSILASYEFYHLFRTATPTGGTWDKAAVDALRVGVEADLV